VTCTSTKAHNSVSLVTCPARPALIAQTPSGDISHFSWARKFNPARILAKIEELHNRSYLLEMEHNQVSVPRLSTSLLIELISEAIADEFKSLGYSAPTTDQSMVLKEFIQGRDVFVSMPMCIVQ